MASQPVKPFGRQNKNAKILSSYRLITMITWRYPKRHAISTVIKTMVVKYYTYKDFVNVYNDHAKDNISERYAIIDLEAGVVYKP